MRAALFPGQGIEAKVLLPALKPHHPLVVEASTALGFDLVRQTEQVARRVRGVMPTTLAQPGIFVAGVIAHEEAVERGESFEYLLGHSLGEYTALVAGGSIAFRHALGLISARAGAMHRAARLSSGSMAAVLGLDHGTVEQIATANDLAIANDNSPKQLVLSGPSDAMSIAAQDIRNAGGRSILLSVEGAFHSPAMLPAVDDLRNAFMSVNVRQPSVPVISNVTARPYRAPGEIPKLLIAQLTGTVRFREAVGYLADQGVDQLIDLGPGDVVGRLARSTVDAMETVHA